MRTKRTHRQNLRRARVRREKGLLTHRVERKLKIEEAWRNIFVKAGILEPK